MNYQTLRQAVHLLVAENGGKGNEADVVMAKLILNTPVSIMQMAEQQAQKAEMVGRLVEADQVKEDDILNHIRHGVLDQVLSTARDFTLEEHGDFNAYHH